MKQASITRFILIDDLEINNDITALIIRKVVRDMDVITFTQPVEALAYLKKEYPGAGVPTIVLLDINMPGVNGWDVLDMLELCDPAITNFLEIYMLSSSIDLRDKRRAAEAPNCVGFLERPFTMEMVQSLLESRANAGMAAGNISAPAQQQSQC